MDFHFFDKNLYAHISETDNIFKQSSFTVDCVLFCDRYNNDKDSMLLRFSFSSSTCLFKG